MDCWNASGTTDLASRVLVLKALLRVPSEPQSDTSTSLEATIRDIDHGGRGECKVLKFHNDDDSETPLAIPFLGGSILFLSASPLILDGFLICKEVSATAV
jgi:hypothetical protein